jgi:hypothetical protein
VQQYARTVKVHVAPQYAGGAHGVPGSGVRSLSRAVSDYARQSDSASPRPSWAIGLPANQKCG